MLLPSILSEVLIEQVQTRGLRCVSHQTSIENAIQTLRITTVLGVQRDSQMLGLITAHMLIQALANGTVQRQSPVADICQPASTISLDQLADLPSLLRQPDLLSQLPLLVTTAQGDWVGLLRLEDVQQTLSPETLLRRVRVRDLNLSLGTTVSPQTPVQKLAEAMTWPALVVSEEGHQPLGWVTSEAVLEEMAVNPAWSQRTAANLLTPLPSTVDLDDSLGVACDRIATAPWLVVTEAGRFCGVLQREQLQTFWDPHEYLQSRYSLEQTVLEQTLELSQLNRYQRQLRQTLARSESRYQAMVENAPVGISQTDATGQFVQVNRQLCDLLGYTEAELLAKRYQEITHPEDLPKSASEVQCLEAGEVPFVVLEKRYLHKDGSPIWVQVTLTCLADADGTIVSDLAVIEDIRDRKRTEIELTRAKEDADAANRAKSVFIANMSHELRTPLNIILGFTQVLLQDPHLVLTQRETLNTILQSGDHLLSLINDVLHVAKIEANRVVLHSEDMHLAPFLGSLALMLQGQAAAKGLLLRTDMAANFPASIHIDQGKLRQILINLLSNAIKFTPSGWVQLRCFCLPRSPLGQIDPPDTLWLRFEVEDTGVGMSAAELEIIFEPFSQVSQQFTLSEGTGLGLTISRQYTELMGGQLTVCSEPEQGSTFTLDLPCRPLTPSAVPVPLPGSQIRVLPGQPPRRMLVVDDVPTNRKVLTKLLNPLSWSIQEASNGQEAVDIWQQWQPDVIWMDLRMPVIDGYEAIRQIRRLEAERLIAHPGTYRSTCILVLTAGSLEDEVSRSLMAGANDIALKPLSQQRLFDLLGKHLHLAYTYVPIHAPADLGPPNAFTDLLPLQPDDWLQALYYAALCCDDGQVSQMLQSLPPESQIIAQGLQPLLYEFRFDAIAQLLQPYLPASFGLTTPM